jgi:hypothetical protein
MMRGPGEYALEIAPARLRAHPEAPEPPWPRAEIEKRPEDLIGRARLKKTTADIDNRSRVDRLTPSHPATPSAPPTTGLDFVTPTPPKSYRSRVANTHDRRKEMAESPQGVALELLYRIAAAENRSTKSSEPNWDKKSKQEILDTYAECLEATLEKRPPKVP